MAAIKLETFGEIVAAVREELKVQAEDVVSVARIKRLVNMAYIHEVLPAHNWWWLRKTADVITEAPIQLGTASVTALSDVVVLTESPPISLKGWYFAANNYEGISRVKFHEADSDTLILETPYMGLTDPEAAYTLWTDEVPLPVDLRETQEVWHDHALETLTGVGQQEFRQATKLNPRFEGMPVIYTTDDYINPTEYQSVISLPAVTARKSEGLLRSLVFASTLGATGATALLPGDRVRITGVGHEAYNGDVIIAAIATTNAANDAIVYTGLTKRKENNIANEPSLVIKRNNSENEVSRTRRLRVHPSIIKSQIVLHVDYMQDVPPMELDSDEPVLPIEDRIVLFYGALITAWSSIGRNPEEAARNSALFQNKLLLMKNRQGDSIDHPVLRVSRDYIQLKRRGR